MILCVVAASNFARADTLPSWLVLTGFGTVGAFHADSPVATVRADNRVSSGSKNDTVYDQDSLLGLQANVNPTGTFDAAMQLISKKDIDSTNRPRVQWAYVGWKPNDEFDFKLGRSVATVYLMSDYRDVYYSQIAARPQGTVYYLNPITYNDGGSGLWQKYFGVGTLSVEGYYGKTKVNVATGKVDVTKQYSVAVKWSQGSFTIRGAAGAATINFTATPGGTAAQLLGALATAQAAGVCSNCASALQNEMPVNDIVNHVASLSAQWDDGSNVLQAEVTQRHTASLLIGSAWGWYALGARHFGNWTPYVVFGHMAPKHDQVGLIATPPANPTAGQRALLGAVALANATNVYGPYDRDQDAIGVRWDFHDNMDLKFQVDRYRVKNAEWGSTGTVTFPIGPTSTFDGHVNAYTLNLDFIF